MTPRKPAKIGPGRWCFYPIDTPLPARLAVYAGSWENRRQIDTATRYEAMAAIRYWENGGIWWRVRDGHRQLSIYVIGDVDAFDQEEDGQ